MDYNNEPNDSSISTNQNDNLFNYLNEYLINKMDNITQEMIDKEPEQLGKYRAYAEIHNLINQPIK